MTSLMDVMLGSLEHDGECLAYYAGKLDKHVTFMADDIMPKYSTAAEARLEDAEEKLHLALVSVRNARAGLRPIDLRLLRVAS